MVFLSVMLFSDAKLAIARTKIRMFFFFFFFHLSSTSPVGKKPEEHLNVYIFLRFKIHGEVPTWRHVSFEHE